MIFTINECRFIYQNANMHSQIHLIYKCKRLDNNIILFLDESIEKIRILKNMKRISINNYFNNLYKYYCKKANIQYKDIIDTKNNFSINEEIFDEIIQKYKYVEKNQGDIFYL